MNSDPPSKLHLLLLSHIIHHLENILRDLFFNLVWCNVKLEAAAKLLFAPHKKVSSDQSSSWARKSKLVSFSFLLSDMFMKSYRSFSSCSSLSPRQVAVVLNLYIYTYIRAHSTTHAKAILKVFWKLDLASCYYVLALRVVQLDSYSFSLCQYKWRQLISSFHSYGKRCFGSTK